MKLIRAKFENFRLLRDLKLDFSTNSTRKLTIIRAENATGKTTILNALQWALYGDTAFPEKGRNYRMSPIDWNDSRKTEIPISVQVDFETTNFRKTRKGELIEITEQYRIIRSAYETLNGINHNRSPSTVELFKLTNKGSEPIEAPEGRIQEKLPLELREVFFTDGDRVLSFIEATQSAKAKNARRARVERAIRSLLGLEVIENALTHLKNTVLSFTEEAEKIGADEELKKVAAELKQMEENEKMLMEEIEDSKSQYEAFEEKIADIQKKIDIALVKGDREKLKHDIENIELQLKQINHSRIEMNKVHSQLFRSLSLSRDLLSPILEKSLRKLDELRERGELPSTTIPVLEERLKGTICICGESLDQHSSIGKHRREHIQQLIEKSRKADEIQSILTDLYFGSLPLQPKEIADDEYWNTKYYKVVERRDELDIMQVDLGTKLKELEAERDGIPDTNIQELLSFKQEYTEQRDLFYTKLVRAETKLEPLKKAHGPLVKKLDSLLDKQEEGKGIQARLNVTGDVNHVLANSFDRIKNEELTKVSNLMNKLFLEMIGADPKQGAIIQKAEISKEFDILVYGPNRRPLNPDRDLNGASRRALTLAFILALTKVSEVKAPNVIDTPLGMMSGFVKRSVLRISIRESSQLILFLTSSEIADCEKILDVEAGQVITLTNTDHYPQMLLNTPPVKEIKVLRCECNHHQNCQLCERRIDVELQTETMSEEVTIDTTIS